MRKRPKQERSRQMVATIIQATELAIARKGFESVTANYVAELAGISKGSLYQYFADRNDLLNALMEKLSDDILSVLDSEIPIRKSDSLFDLVLGSIRAGSSVIQSNRGVYLQMIKHWHELPMERLADKLQIRLLEIAQIYFLRHHREYPISHLPERLFICFNSVMFTMMRLYSQAKKTLDEDQILLGLAQMVTRFLEMLDDEQRVASTS